MRLQTVIKKLTAEYEKAKANKTIRKPISYALYQVWRYADAYEKEKSNLTEINQGLTKINREGK